MYVVFWLNRIKPGDVVSEDMVSDVEEPSESDYGSAGQATSKGREINGFVCVECCSMCVALIAYS